MKGSITRYCHPAVESESAFAEELIVLLASMVSFLLPVLFLLLWILRKRHHNLTSWPDSENERPTRTGAQFRAGFQIGFGLSSRYDI